MSREFDRDFMTPETRMRLQQELDELEVVLPESDQVANRGNNSAEANTEAHLRGNRLDWIKEMLRLQRS